MMSDWFARQPISDTGTRLWEPHVHRYFRGNAFHVRGRDVDMVIDFGMGLVPLRPCLDLTDGKPVIAVATHAHLDHVGCFHAFSERLGHAAEAKIFATMPDSGTFADEFRVFPAAVTEIPYEDWDQKSYRLQPAPLTRVVAEGDAIDLGDEVYEVLHLPGHSPGSIGLLARKSGIFFSGDAIYDGRLIDDIPGADRIAYRATMHRLSKLEVAVAHGGHNEAISQRRMHEIAHAYLHG